ncbi:MAG: tRNA (adenosine(37)-N6)-dimethylallyltransferase MiaA [Endomicrobium sp.]|nr:tRNA (adenosine(37)-N6)-dimethylallyltransferase MiaA [Endomicrobium sp.]
MKDIEIIVLSGPTASGKTRRAVEICKKINGEIISCDSRQVYKYLDIGTNKCGTLIGSGVREIDGVKQYLTDIVDLDRNYNAAEFAEAADLKISEIKKHGKVPVLVGGTGLYIKALLYGLGNVPAADKSLRGKLKCKSNEELYSILLALDPSAAEKNKNNPHRLIRALEINMLSGRTVSEFIKPKIPRYKFKHYSILVENNILYSRINSRCALMIENGMIEETCKVLNMGYDRNCPALNAIGYKYVMQYLDNAVSKKELITEFAKDTRHYAKRQKTWFKAQPEVEFIPGFEYEA